MYDKYGWIVNSDRKTEKEKDHGDSCFFMGLQCLCFLLRNKEEEAKKLYERVKKYDFLRHPTVLDHDSGYYKKGNLTSYDMLVIWDYLANRFKHLKWLKEPPYHYRKSKFFWGKYRHPAMYNRYIAYTAAYIFKLILKTPFKWKFLGKYFKCHLFMLYLGTAYEKSEWYPLLKIMREIVKTIEANLHYENHFFKFITHQEPVETWARPPDNCHEWVYQRNMNLGCNEKRNRIVFHHEPVQMDNRIEFLDLSNQFWYFWVKRFENQ